MDIVHVTKETAKVWVQLCNELWPDCSVKEMLTDFADGKYQNEYLAKVNGSYAAFVSLSVRNEYVEGTDFNPVGYLEGIFVKPEYRRKGIGKQLVNFARDWSVQQGCLMLASDCVLSNEQSRLFHNKVGFAEASVNVHFIMPLA